MLNWQKVDQFVMQVRLTGKTYYITILVDVSGCVPVRTGLWMPDQTAFLPVGRFLLQPTRWESASLFSNSGHITSWQLLNIFLWSLTTGPISLLWSRTGQASFSPQAVRHECPGVTSTSLSLPPLPPGKQHTASWKDFPPVLSLNHVNTGTLISYDIALKGWVFYKTVLKPDWNLVLSLK